MKETEKFKKEKRSEIITTEDIFSFDYYSYRLELLVKKIKSKNYKAYSKA